MVVVKIGWRSSSALSIAPLAETSLRSSLRLLAALILVTTTARAQAGSWSALYDWRTEVVGTGSTSCDLLEFAHAAVIPTGLHRGKVVMWRLNDEWCGGSGSVYTHQTWIFDPDSPVHLIKVTQTLPTSLFCSGHAWDPDGNLVVAGGLTFPPSVNPLDPKAGFRFLPAALGLVLTDQTTGFRLMNASPWRTAGVMSSKHWYPTLMTLGKESIPVNGALSTCGPGLTTFAGGSTVAVGGAFNQSGGGHNLMKGTEVWERLPRGGGSGFICPVIPSDMAVTAENYPTPGARETYARKPDSAPAAPQLTSYPRMFQLSAANAKQVFVMNDTNSDQEDPHESEANLAWAMKIPYASLPPISPVLDKWELWRALRSGPVPTDPQTQPNNDRFYGTALYYSTLEPGTNIRLNDRLIAIGGAQRNSAGNWEVNHSIQEFIPSGSYPDYAAQGGQWWPKMNLNTPQVPTPSRYYLNAVILPTGESLIMGGASSFGATQSVAAPFLYDPGRARNDAGTITTGLAPAPTPPGALDHAPRLYHNLALLLPDGRVFQAGGDDSGMLPDSEYSGEIYSPSYLFQSFRPAITAAPGELDFEPLGGTTDFDLSVTKQEFNTIDRVVLLRPASVTHFFDTDQRYIELRITTIDQAGTDISLKVSVRASRLDPIAVDPDSGAHGTQRPCSS